MRILQEARIESLPMDPAAIDEYWACFDLRDSIFFGQRGPLEVEKAAFLALLNSVIASDPESVSRKDYYVPGAFPLELDDDVVDYSGPEDQGDIGDVTEFDNVNAELSAESSAEEMEDGGELEDASTGRRLTRNCVEVIRRQMTRYGQRDKIARKYNECLTKRRCKAR